MSLVKKAVSIQTARQTIAQTAGPTGLMLYQITDAAEALDNSFKDEFFPFDFNDHQIELYYDLMKKQANQCWSGLDLKLVNFILLGPSQKLHVFCSTFKKKPKNLNLVFNSSPTPGDLALAPGPATPVVPLLLQPGTPDSPDEPFRPLTQCLDQRTLTSRTNTYQTPSRPSNRSNIQFNLNLSTISAGTPLKLRQSTPDSVGLKSNSSINSTFSNRSTTRRSPITKPRKRFTPSPTPKSVRERNSRILDGLEPVAKKPKLDKSNRKKVKARRSLQNWFLANLFQQ